MFAKYPTHRLLFTVARYALLLIPSHWYVGSLPNFLCSWSSSVSPTYFKIKLAHCQFLCQWVSEYKNLKLLYLIKGLVDCHHIWTVTCSDTSEMIKSKLLITSFTWMPNWCPQSTQPIAAYVQLRVMHFCAYILIGMLDLCQIFCADGLAVYNQHILKSSWHIANFCSSGSF